MQQPRRRHGVVAVIRREDRFLVIRRSQFVSAPRAYCFPGGGVESGEDEETALKRELVEELDLHHALPLRRVWTSRTRRHVDLSWWSTEIRSDQIPTANPDEVEEVHWWTVEEMIRCENLLDSNRDFLARFQTGEIVLD